MSDDQNDAKGAPSDSLLGPASLSLADHSRERAVASLIGDALDAAGHTKRAAAQLAAGRSFNDAISKVLPQARGTAAEVNLVALYNRDAGLVGSAGIATRFENPNDPVRDIVVRADGKTRCQVQLKFGTPNYVERAALSGKYPGKIVTSEEAVASLEGTPAEKNVSATFRAERVTTASISDADVTERTRQALTRRLKRVPGLSNWETLEGKLRESAPVALGAAVLTAGAELWKAIESNEPLSVDRVFRASLKSGARALAADQFGRWMMRWLEQQLLKGRAWTQAAIKTVSEYATPAAALASFVIDVITAVWDFLNAKLSVQELWRRLTGKAGAALLGCLGAMLGFFLGSICGPFGPILALLFALLGGALGAQFGEVAGLKVFDALAGTKLPVPSPA